MILEEYTSDLRRKEEVSFHKHNASCADFMQTTSRELRTRNIQNLGSLIRRLDIDASTPWRAAHNVILESEDFRSSRDLQQIETIDILGVYDDYSRQLEQEHEDESRRLRIEHVRKGRKAREGFKLLLQELEAAGELNRRTRWIDTYKRIKDDDRYLALLGPQGSSPMDLWMDAVDDISEELEQSTEKVEKVLRDGKYELKLETTLQEFEGMIGEAPSVAHIEAKKRKEVYELVSRLEWTYFLLWLMRL